MGNINGICCFLARGACGSLFEQAGDFLVLLAVENMYSQNTLNNKHIILCLFQNQPEMS